MGAQFGVCIPDGCSQAEVGINYKMYGNYHLISVLFIIFFFLCSLWEDIGIKGQPESCDTVETQDELTEFDGWFYTVSYA